MPLITKACELCGKEFSRNVSPSAIKRGAAGRYCSSRCSGKARWVGHENKNRRYEYVPGHPLASYKGRIPTSRRVLYDSLGPGAHPCHWCGFMLEWRLNSKGGSTYNLDLLVDHLDGNALNDDPANLAATCQSCNTVRALARGWTERTGRPITDLVTVTHIINGAGNDPPVEWNHPTNVRFKLT